MASRKKNNIPTIAWIGIAIGLILVVLIALSARMKEPAVETYNGFPVQKGMCPGTTRECVLISFQIRGVPYEIPFYNHPKDVETIPIAPAAVRAVINMQKVQNHTILIVVPTDAPGDIGVAGVQLGRILGDRYGIMNLNVKALSVDDMQSACRYATKQQLVIWFESDKINAVHEIASQCIVISAVDGPSAVATTEAFTYKILGVIPTVGSVSTT